MIPTFHFFSSFPCPAAAHEIVIVANTSGFAAEAALKAAVV